MNKITNPDTREKLGQVIRVLDEVIEQNRGFNICSWLQELECGTAACAIGYAAQDQWFIDRGLHLVKGEMSFAKIAFWPMYDGYSDFTAINKFFGLSRVESMYLFSNGDYMRYSNAYRITALVVKKRINRVLQRGFPNELSI